MANPKYYNKTSAIEKGLQCETLARAYLEKQKCVFITQNFRSRFGEIDLIMEDKCSNPTTLVFVEVRYRKSQQFGGALESIDFYKQHRIIQTAQIYLLKSFSHQEYPPCRFDVILISGHLVNPCIQWIANAFECE